MVHTDLCFANNGQLTEFNSVCDRILASLKIGKHIQTWLHDATRAVRTLCRKAQQQLKNINY